MQVHQNVSFMRDSISSGVTFIKEEKNNTRNWSWLDCQNFLKNKIGWGNKAYVIKRHVNCQNKITIGRKLNPWQDGKSNSILTFGHKFMRKIRDCKIETSTDENNGKLIAPLQNDMNMTKETHPGVKYIGTFFHPQVMDSMSTAHCAPQSIWCIKKQPDVICPYNLIKDNEAENELDNKEVKDNHNRSEVQSKTEANRKYSNDVTVQKHEGLAIIRALKQCQTSIITIQPCFEVDMGNRSLELTDKKITIEWKNCSYSFKISRKNDTWDCTIELSNKSKLGLRYTLVYYTRSTPFKKSESSQSRVYYGFASKQQNARKTFVLLVIKTVYLLTDCSNITKYTAIEMFDGFTDGNIVALSKILTVNRQMSEHCNINIAAKQKHQIGFRGKCCWNHMDVLSNEHEIHFGNFDCTNSFKTIFAEIYNGYFLKTCDEIDTNSIFARLNLEPIAFCSSGRFNNHVEVDGHVFEQTQPFLKLCQHISLVKPFHLKKDYLPNLVGCSKSESSSKHCLFPKRSNIANGTKSPSKIDKSVNSERPQELDKPSFDQVCFQLKHNQLPPSYIKRHIHSDCTEAPVATINTVVVDSTEDKATQNIVDLKHKHVSTGNRNSCFNTKIKTCDPNKTKRSHEKGSFTSDHKIVVDEIKKTRSHGKGSFTSDHKSYVDDIRALTWLPLDQLPVPEVDITVALLFDPLDTIFQQMARGDTPGPEITMRYELLRLCTLRNYPKNNKPYIIRLAGAGFYYAAEGDEVVCYCCGIRKSSWTENDKPLEIHRHASPSCSFLTRNSQVNIRVPEPEGPSTDRFGFIEVQAESNTLNSRSSNPVQSSINGTFSSNDRVSQGISTGNSAISRHRVPGNLSRISTGNSNNTRTGAPAGNLLCSNYQTQIATTSSHHSSTPPDVYTTAPKHPTYAVKSVRSASFERWPLTTGQTPEVMADAGYYYAGIEDAVRCFHCGIGLRHWTPDDNPYIEHARWSRNCVYLKLIKGEEFISLVHLAMQFTDDNEEQTGATGGAAASQIPVDEINKILLTDAGQSVLEMGYQPKTIKQAIEEILKDSGKPGISSSTIMAKVLEMEERRSLQELAKEVGHLEIKSQGSNEQIKTQNVPSQTDKNTKKTQIADNSSGKQAVPLRKDPKAIKAENDKMVEQTLCKVCMNNTVCIVFLPCGHLVTCAECAPAMRKCPICRTLVKGTVKAFMS